MTTRILIADDSEIVRKGLYRLLETDEHMCVVGAASTGEEAVDKAQELDPDIVLMDVVMPGLNGVEATRRIQRSSPEKKTIGLSVYSEKTYILSMLEAGAVGYLLKDCAFDELREAIQNVQGGNLYLGKGARQVITRDCLFLLQRVEGGTPSSLSKDQFAIIDMIVNGMSLEEIASKMSRNLKHVNRDYQIIIKKWLYLNSISNVQNRMSWRSSSRKESRGGE
jgi:DNA-binding NarL/FixJ family response regulator